MIIFFTIYFSCLNIFSVNYEIGYIKKILKPEQTHRSNITLFKQAKKVCLPTTRIQRFAIKSGQISKGFCETASISKILGIFLRNEGSCPVIEKKKKQES